MNVSRTRSALIIGGTGALGQAISLKLAADGYDIAFTYRSRAETAHALCASLVAAGHNAEAAQLDIGDAQAVQRVIGTLCGGALDGLIYASGPHFQLGFVSAIDTAEWSRVIDTDVKGFFNVVATCLPLLRAAGSASIVAVTTSAVRRPPAMDALSAAPKSAITSLIHSLAVEEGRHGIRANGVAPGFIDAGLGQAMLDTMLSPSQREAILRATPLARLGNAQDVADAVSFLCSEKASFITGNTLTVSGGVEL